MYKICRVRRDDVVNMYCSSIILPHHPCWASAYSVNSIVLVLYDARGFGHCLTSRSLLHGFLPFHRFVDCEMVSVDLSHYYLRDCMLSAEPFKGILLKVYNIRFLRHSCPFYLALLFYTLSTASSGSVMH